MLYSIFKIFSSWMALPISVLCGQQLKHKIYNKCIRVYPHILHYRNATMLSWFMNVKSALEPYPSFCFSGGMFVSETASLSQDAHIHTYCTHTHTQTHTHMALAGRVKHPWLLFSSSDRVNKQRHQKLRQDDAYTHTHTHTHWLEPPE